MSVDYFAELRNAQIQGYRYITGKLDDIAVNNRLTMFNEPAPEWNFRQSVAMFARWLTPVRNIVRNIDPDAISNKDSQIHPWCLGFNGGTRMLETISVEGFDFDRIDFVVAWYATWELERFALHWDDEIVEPIKTYQREVWEFIDELSAKKEQDTVVEVIARQLSGKHPAIFRFLASRPNGVTFSEFKNYRDPATQYRLTESDNDESIEKMLRRHSNELADHGWEYEVRLASNLIKAVRISN